MTRTTCETVSSQRTPTRYPQAELKPANGKPLHDSDIAKLVRAGNFAPWNNPSYRYADVGNDALYHLCELHPLPSELPTNDCVDEAEGILAGKMWLIGRSYAASPERYSYSKKGERKPKQDERKGYTDFFHDISHILLTGEMRPCDKKQGTGYKGPGELKEVHHDFEKLLLELSAMQASEYTFSSDHRENDANILSHVQHAVTTFASLVRRARYIRDLAIKNNQSGTESFTEEHQLYPRSFSSKFLHFHFPKLFFIYDSNVERNLYKSRKIVDSDTIERFFSDGSSFIISVDKRIAAKSSRNDSTSKELDAKYANYADKAYALANVLYQKFSKDSALVQALELGVWEHTRHDPLPKYYSITRMLDSLVSNSLPHPPSN